MDIQIIKKSSLGESLGHIFETGLYSDIAFLVGENGFKINAHKTIISARSEPLATMCQERWNSEKTLEIPLPINNKTAVKPFLQYLYTDKISFGDMELDDILEVTHLAHMYQVQKLLDECSVHLTSSICEDNCLQIYKSCQLLNKELSDRAFQFFLANLVQTHKVKDTYLQYDEDLLTDILSDDGQHVPEILLLKALLKWREADDSRKSIFDKLIRLIRFPTMTATDFANEVVPTEILPMKDMVEIFAHISTKKAKVEYPCSPRHPVPSKGHFIPLFEEIRTPLQWEQIIPSGCASSSDFQLQFSYPRAMGRDVGLRLRGIRIFGPRISHKNVATLIAHLKPGDYRISVSITEEGRGNIASVSRSMDEIATKGLDVGFSSSVILKCGLFYTFTTTLQPEPQLGGTRTMSTHYEDCVYQNSAIERRIKRGGHELVMTINKAQEAYCYIHELILTPSVKELEISNCVVT